MQYIFKNKIVTNIIRMIEYIIDKSNLFKELGWRWYLYGWSIIANQQNGSIMHVTMC